MNTDLFIHESDKTAMDALKAIPGFAQVVKAFMKIWNEKQYKIINMSTNLKISEQQLAKYNRMLIPICEKLGIEVPELYVTLDVNPNAYTYGDTKPFIVITSGMFETVPDELIPTILAHECGHIACHHTLYLTMGRFLLGSAAAFLPGIAGIALYPIQLAFAYWMRCSEFSADRVAAVCDGSSEKIVELCMYFAGYNKSIIEKADQKEFINQANDYLELIGGSAINRTFEFFMFANMSHPMNAVRAYEINKWCELGNIEMVENYVKNAKENANTKTTPVSLTIPTEDGNSIQMREGSKYYTGKHYHDVQLELQVMGFTNITIVPVQKDKFTILKQSHGVSRIEINGISYFERGNTFKADAEVVIFYYE